MKNVPTPEEFFEAIKLIEAFLKAELEALKAEFPQSADYLDMLIQRLTFGAKTIEVLASVASEIRGFTQGKGPVSHDPVDHA